MTNSLLNIAYFKYHIKKCPVCLENKPRNDMLFCNKHIGSCNDCWEEIRGQKCPICRTDLFKETWYEGIDFTYHARKKLSAESNDCRSITQISNTDITFLMIWLRELEDSDEILEEIVDTENDEAFGNIINNQDEYFTQKEYIQSFSRLYFELFDIGYKYYFDCGEVYSEILDYDSEMITFFNDFYLSSKNLVEKETDLFEICLFAFWLNSCKGGGYSCNSINELR